MATKLPSGKYRVQIRVRGRPPIDRVFEAKKAAIEFERAQRKRIAESAPVFCAAMSFEAAWRAYSESMRYLGKRLTTRKTEASRIKRGLEELGPYSLELLADGQRIARFRDHLMNERLRIVERGPRGELRPKKGARRRDGNADGKLSPDAIRLELAAVSAVMNWAAEQRLILSNPVPALAKPAGRRRRRRMERDEELNVFILARKASHVASQLGEDARFVAIQREIGCRPGELARVLREDIDLAARALRFRDTKNDTDRVIPLVETAVPLIASQLVQAEVRAEGSPYLFTSFSRSGHHCIPFYYRSAVDRLRKANVVAADFHAHAARKEFTSSSFEHGVPHEDIRKMTGHKSLSALEVYNVSDALHPDARGRLEVEASRREAERFEDFASALGVPVDKLKKFILAEQRHRGAPDANLGPAPALDVEAAASKVLSVLDARTSLRGEVTPVRTPDAIEVQQRPRRPKERAG